MEHGLVWLNNGVLYNGYHFDSFIMFYIFVTPSQKALKGLAIRASFSLSPKLSYIVFQHNISLIYLQKDIHQQHKDVREVSKVA